VKLAFLSVPARDYDTSKAFYEDILGLTVIEEYDGAPHRFTDYQLGDSCLKVYEWLEPWHAGHFTSFMMSTPDLDGLLEKVAAAGYEARSPEITGWGGRIAAVKDPFGNILNLLDEHQPVTGHSQG